MRAVTTVDYAEIARLLDAAFNPSQDESRLVSRLRGSGKPIYEWVSDDERGLSGYICYSNAFHGSEVIGLHLAPVAVRPDVQGRRVGSKLIVDSLAALETKEVPIFVLGDPRYYRRFGFVHVDSPICLFDQKNEHFMALRWSKGPQFVVGYEDEFKEA